MNRACFRAISSSRNLFYQQTRYFAKLKIQLGSIAESVSEATVKSFEKNAGDWVEVDDIIMTFETAKNDAQVRCTETGLLTQFFVEVDQDVEVGVDIFEIDTDAKKPAGGAPAPEKEKATTTGGEKEKTTTTGGEKEKATPAEPTKTAPPPPAPKAESRPSLDNLQKAPTGQAFPNFGGAPGREERREKMTRMRRTVAQRLKESQNTNASVTTFQEIDMKMAMDIRKELGEEYLKRNGNKLGFMSFFIKACARGLVERPIVNAMIDNTTNEIVYKNYVDISVAMAAPKGLVTPVLRNVEKMTFNDVENAMKELAGRAKANQLAIEDLTGGTFTISNGGVFGSMLSAPIINPPQTAIMGMHNIVNRPVVRNGQIVARPIMYVSLTYDHRLIDGREGAGYLKRVSDLIDDPRRLLLEL